MKQAAVSFTGGVKYDVFPAPPSGATTIHKEIFKP